jgi:hypothetical protein
MERIRIFALLILLLALTFSCKNNQENESERNLEESVSKMNLPQRINESTVLTDCFYEGKVFTYCYQIQKDTLLLIGKDSLQHRTLDNLKTNLYSQKLVKNLIMAKSNLRYIYTCGTDSIVYTFTPKDLSGLE